MTAASPKPRGGTVKKNPTPTKIKKARAAAGLTQDAAAALIYATLRSWQDYEGGQRRMHAGLFELFEIKAERLKGET